MYHLRFVRLHLTSNEQPDLKRRQPTTLYRLPRVGLRLQLAPRSMLLAPIRAPPAELVPPINWAVTSSEFIAMFQDLKYDSFPLLFEVAS